MNLTGSCFCRSVKYQLTGHLGIFQYCHCSRCRKTTGSAHAANLFVRPENFQWLEGEAQVGRFEPEDAEYFATSFCRTCGSSLPWLAKTGKVVVIPVGTLDEDPEIRPSQNIFWESRADWYVSVDDLPKYATLPPKKR